MKIRLAAAKDSFALSVLLSELGYENTEVFIDSRLAQLIDDPAEELLVVVHGSMVIGFISLHFIPQLALSGDFARVSYFCIAQGERGKSVGQRLLQHAEQRARQRGCDRMEVHCHERRSQAHAFYAREGYRESPRYLIKSFRE